MALFALYSSSCKALKPFALPCAPSVKAGWISLGCLYLQPQQQPCRVLISTPPSMAVADETLTLPLSLASALAIPFPPASVMRTIHSSQMVPPHRKVERKKEKEKETTADEIAFNHEDQGLQFHGLQFHNSNFINQLAKSLDDHTSPRFPLPPAHSLVGRRCEALCGE